jgi:hypothetical protein
LTGRPVVIRVEASGGPAPEAPATNGFANRSGERRKQLMGLPLFRKAGESLGAQIWHVDEDFNPTAPPRPASELATDADTDET